MAFLSRFVAWLGDNKTQRTVFTILRTIKPVLILGDKALVVKHADVVEVLNRNADFTIAEINAPKMDALNIHFFLGMDASPEHDRDFKLMQSVAKREDLEVIRKLVKDKADECISKIKSSGKIDLVNDLSRVVPVYLLQKYFGVMDSSLPYEKMQHWMRILFQQLFLNLNNDKKVEQQAQIAAKELETYLLELIIKRKTELQNGIDDDTMLTRLIKLQQQPNYNWLTDDVIRRNITGLIIGEVDTTNKCVVHVIDELFRNHNEMQDAIQAATDNNIEKVKQYCWEALRFNPHNQVILRYCKNDTTIGEQSDKPKKIKAGTLVFAVHMSAMLDSDVFTNPMSFDLNRKTEYMHFGYGMHECYGKYINGVTIPELVAATLRLKNLKRANGKKGKVTYDVLFPDSITLEFEN